MSAIIGRFMANSANNGTRGFQVTGSALKNRMRPVHPGEVLREDYLKPLERSANALATALKTPASRINDIVLERRGVTVDTAMRIVRYFGGDLQSWMNLQTAYEIKVAEKLIAKRVFSEVQPLATWTKARPDSC
jgi:antitoxin HigA-1